MSLSDQHFFKWVSFDVRAALPLNWEEKVVNFADTRAVSKTLIPTSITSRESSKTAEITVLTVDGAVIKEELSWLSSLYHGLFRDLAQSLSDEKIVTARNTKYGINLNVQRGNKMRYEAHVDSNPLAGLFYVTTHGFGDGGELVVGNQLNSKGISEIDRDCTSIYPQAGYLIFFDARLNPHYVRSLRDPHGMRVVAAMNFYTNSCSENDRPEDLDSHLGLI